MYYDEYGTNPYGMGVDYMGEVNMGVPQGYMYDMQQNIGNVEIPDNYGYSQMAGQPQYGFELDVQGLLNLGFTQEEINVAQNILYCAGKIISASRISQLFQINYEVAQKIYYLFQIHAGRVSIQTPDDISKHYRKMFGKHFRIGINNLENSIREEIPRRALVGRIPEGTPYALWNSKKYDKYNRLYNVIDVKGSKIIVETDRIPTLKYGQALSQDGMFEILGKPVNGRIQVAFNKDYCKLCNRFVIVAALREPQFHLGMVRMICMDGTWVYVFADILGAKKYNRYGTNSQRIYDYGFLPDEILSKLQHSTENIYKKLYGVYYEFEPANTNFEMLEPENEKEKEDECLVE